MNQSSIKWVLFVTMTLTSPLLYYMFVVGGFLPFAAIAALMILDPHPWGFFLFNGIHLLVYGLILFFFACVLAKQLYRIREEERSYWVFGAVVGLLLIGLLPIYGIGHSSVELTNVYELYWEFGLRMGF